MRPFQINGLAFYTSYSMYFALYTPELFLSSSLQSTVFPINIQPLVNIIMPLDMRAAYLKVQRLCPKFSFNWTHKPGRLSRKCPPKSVTVSRAECSCVHHWRQWPCSKQHRAVCLVWQPGKIRACAKLQKGSTNSQLFFAATQVNSRQLT